MKRWILYATTSLGFGVFDWFFVSKISLVWAPESRVPTVAQAGAYFFNIVFWLVPILPITIHEAGLSEQAKRPIKAGILTWTCAVLAYYATYAVRLSLGMVKGWEHLNILAGKENEFWPQYWTRFNELILLQILDWIWVAILGGAIVGWLAFRAFGLRPGDTNQG